MKMGSKVLVDTSGWVHYFVPTEPFFETTNAFIHEFRSTGVELITTNYILAELTALLQQPLRLSKRRQARYLTSLRKASWVRIIHIDEYYDRLAWNLFFNRLDKRWSLVDCASFVIMQKEKTLYALSTDHHFEQAGFLNLLK